VYSLSFADGDPDGWEVERQVTLMFHFLAGKPKMTKAPSPARNLNAATPVGRFRDSS
jgi:hypothetical protein